MEQIETIKKDEELGRMAKMIREEFRKHIASEKDLSNILLKGHLLAEQFLDHIILLVFDKEKQIRKMSFYAKVKCLEANKIFENYSVIKHILDALFSINTVRNNLAHNLEFKITISEVDTIGYCFGRDYIVQRYKYTEKDENSLKDLLIWVLNALIWESCWIIVDQILNANLKPNKS